MIRNLFLCILLCAAFSLTGGDFDDLTEGLWHLSFPENSGEIKQFGEAFRFHKDGSVERVYSKEAALHHEKVRARYKERTGKDMPEPRFTWSVKDGNLHFKSNFEYETSIRETSNEYDSHAFFIYRPNLSPFLLTRFVRELRGKKD